VEAPWEIERLLDKTDIGLCLDTGHLLLGGGDPVQAVRDWGARINHVHLKDVRMETVEALLEERAPIVEVWRQRAFCALGDGDLDVDGVLDALTAAGYRGWLVVEQDTLPGAPDQAALDQRRNREYLRIRGL
jgi:inosose dehydratase